MADPAPPGSPSNFASLLAAFTSGVKKTAEPWDTAALDDDVATISYEQALRTHRRVRGDELAPRPAEVNTGETPAPADTKNARKTVSVTIRVSEIEGQQLHARAEEAGLSVSAYLRSCAFEADSLRTQVKEALAQMRTNPANEHPSPEQRPPVSKHWRFHIFPGWLS